MSIRADAVAFFAQARWGSRYGVVDEFHRIPHKGLDVGLFHGDIDVPALHGGIVANVASDPNVGHIVQVERADGLIDTYGHIVPGVRTGDEIPQFARLGRQAVTQAEGGIQWQGQHTHLTLSRTLDGWGVWGYVNLDPTPGVIAVLTAAADLDSSPLNDSTDTKEEEELMEKPILLELTNRDNSRQWALVYPVAKVWVAIWTIPAANALSTAFGTLTPVNPAEWNDFRAAVGLPANAPI